ncbi:hypothetical protein BU17DRAFT_71473 [Hysterangium stoloniferum]|nr:hypothetical protein BU17DRAFT_71473 [Hysterangium stoloniferum]
MFPKFRILCNPKFIALCVCRFGDDLRTNSHNKSCLLPIGQQDGDELVMNCVSQGDELRVTGVMNCVSQGDKSCVMRGWSQLVRLGNMTTSEDLHNKSTQTLLQIKMSYSILSAKMAGIGLRTGTHQPELVCELTTLFSFDTNELAIKMEVQLLVSAAIEGLYRAVGATLREFVGQCEAVLEVGNRDDVPVLKLGTLRVTSTDMDEESNPEATPRIFFIPLDVGHQTKSLQ